MDTSYIKSNVPTREEREPLPEPKQPAIGPEGDGERSTRLIYVLAEGAETERKYFSPVTNGKVPGVKVLYERNMQSGMRPLDIQQRWEKIQADKIIEFRGDYYDIEDLDSIYFVCDVDEKYKDLKNIFTQITSEERSHWVVSNPCFEVWLYYCYKNDPGNDLKVISSLGCDKRSQKMKTLWAPQNKRHPAPAFYRLDDGIAHAWEHYNEDEYHIPTLFSTRMHVVAKEIKAMAEEYEQSEAIHKARKEGQQFRYTK